MKETPRNKEEEGSNYTPGGKQELWNSILTAKPENDALKGRAQQNSAQRRFLCQASDGQGWHTTKQMGAESAFNPTPS